MNSYDYCIVGAGPSGLTFAYNLIKKNKSLKIKIIEKSDRVGGLAKSYDYNGHIFDTGPKRFHTDDPVVKDFLKEISNLKEIGRSTKVHFLNKYFDWPLNIKSIIKMPLNESIKSLYDLIFKEDFRDLSSFENYIKMKYGNNLYNIFFKPYTEKFLRHNASDLHADWASTGINRTIIDKRINANSFLEIIKSLTLPKKINTKFLYPNAGGFGNFFDLIFKKISNQVSTTFDNQIINLEKINTKETNTNEMLLVKCSNKDQFLTRKIIWTGNLNNLTSIIKKDFYSSLKYINTIFYNFIIKKKFVSNQRAQWIYISDGKKLISRITCMKEFSELNCPDDYYNFIVEVTDSQKDPIFFEKSDLLTNDILKELIDINFIKKISSIEDVKINKILDTYPVYHLEYKSAFNDTTKLIRNFSKNIHLIGRSGAYWYNNSDHSIRMALDVSNSLLKKESIDFDHRKYF